MVHFGWACWNAFEVILQIQSANRARSWKWRIEILTRFQAVQPLRRWPSLTRFADWTGSGSATHAFPSTCDGRSNRAWTRLDPIGPDSRPPRGASHARDPRALE